MNQFRDLFDCQKEHFATGTTRSYDWRVDQIDQMRQMVAENDAALQAAIATDFKRLIRLNRGAAVWFWMALAVIGGCRPTVLGGVDSRAS